MDLSERTSCLGGFRIGDPEIRRAVEIYIDAKQSQQVSASTLRIIRRVMADFCEWFTAAGGAYVSQITVLAVQAWLDSKRGTVSPATLHIYFRNLRTFSYYFEDLTEGQLRSPFHNKALHAPRIPADKRPAVSADEVVQFCSAITGEHALRNRAFFLTAFDSGMRLAEVCALRVCDIDLVTGRIEILEGKGRKYRVSFVSMVTLRAIRRYLAGRDPADHEPLFMSATGGHLTAQGMQAIRYKIERRAGVKLGGFHALRRGFAKAYLKNGGDLFTLQTLLGHEQVETTRGYVQLDPEELGEIYARNSPLDRAKRRK